MEIECRAAGLVPMRFAFFPFHPCKVLRLPPKRDAKAYDVLHLSRKIILANLKIWCTNAQEISALISQHLINMSLVLRLPREIYLCSSFQMSHAFQGFRNCYKNLTHCSLLAGCRIPSVHPSACHTNDASTSKSGANMLSFLTCSLRNVLRATTAWTFWTSQLPKVCYVHFDFEMCFAPQRRALFRRLNFQKWSGAEVLYAFWLANVLRATTVCNFSSLIWASWLRTRRFSKPTFRPSGATIIGKTPCFATFLPFRAPAASFFWLLLFSDLSSSSSASSFLFADSSHLCFSICPYCRKFEL